MTQSSEKTVYFCRKLSLTGRNPRPPRRPSRLVNINPPGGHPPTLEKPRAAIIKFGFDMGSHSD
ncbi:hypothetical protein EFQ99_33045 [Rhizobium vallis]|uniref:Uncharacterized protein n=1 Tax=Rhizobium vallis TaxID=634290 RepID=A0A3S0QKQ3_9HYPH|nr:hypothetical protein EFQ99_33045 [Rhizobium vallis]